ncbi:MAG: hypothetical protein KA133_02235 [Flavobacterium sp.]|nr:hypothetical protein [Flavobacterium sp.]
MLSFKKQLHYLAIASLFLLFSCQSEVEEQVYSTQATITKSSPLTTYLQRVVMVKTIQDNLIDKSSYCTIKLPYKVTVNNVAISINTTADYQKVLDNINAFPNDSDIVRITFPVTMVYYNYVEKVINSQPEFESLLSYWDAEPDLLSKINCLNINYPITINIYNTASQLASSVQITSDFSFFNFINNLKESQFISLSYPISIADNNNHVTTIANNSQLENAIKHTIDTCPENINLSLDFLQVLTNKPWRISFFYDDFGKTSLYNGFVFVFKNDNSVIATKLGISVTGQWETKINNGVREFRIRFSPDLLHQLDEDWKVFEFNNSQLRFRKEGDSNDNHYLYFEKI